ncbi:MAG: MBL fold metallo-hydrolase [Planctomycetota bacterium]
MRVRFWGVRGATASTDAQFLGVGGNTPCVEVRDADDALLILDAGIGLYWLGKKLLAGPHGRGQGRVTLLLSHSHWDHIQGFPFFVPAFIPGNQIQVLGGGVERLEDTLEGQMNPTYSPLVSLANLGAKVSIEELPEVLEVGSLRVRHALSHNGQHTVVAYRVEEEGRSLCYVCEVDHPDGRPRPEVLELARGADLLIHESFFTDEELTGDRPSLAGRAGPKPTGHSSFGEATDVALAAGVRSLLYFYHHPDHDDATIEAQVAAQRARLAAAGATLQVDTAREGAEVDL